MPAAAEDGDRCSVASVQDKGLSTGDGDISGIARSTDQFKLPVLREDNRRDVATDPWEPEEITHVGDVSISQWQPHNVDTGCQGDGARAVSAERVASQMHRHR